MEKISKPALVDLLRLADRQRWFTPRIRFASVRSKPQLIQDLRLRFRDLRAGVFVLFRPLGRLPAHVPVIKYDTKRRTFLLNGERIDVPKVSRERPAFAIRHNVYMEFWSSPGQSKRPPATPSAAAGAGMFRVPSTGGLPG